MTTWRSFMCALLAMGIGLAAGGEEKQSESMGWQHCATIPLLKAAPNLDGKLDDGEWDNATGTVNFMNTFGKEEPSFEGMHMDLREGRTICGYYGDMLYIAMVSSLPPRAVYPGGLHSLAKERDAELIGDFNGIEIWLDPNRDRRESREGDQAFYQIFINSVGSIYDAKLVPGMAPDKGWNAEVKSGHQIDGVKKIWTAEIAISLKELGWESGTAAGRSMGALISRNYKAPWNQATWFPHGNAFVAWYLYPRVYFTKDEPAVRIESLGEKLWDAQPEFKVTLFNPGPARTAKVNMLVKSSDMPDLKDEKEVALPANGKAEYSYAVGKDFLHPTADHYFKLHVTPADNSKVWFDYAGMWTRNPRTTKGSGAAARPVRWSEMGTFEQKWWIRAEAAPQNSLGIAAYPYYKQLNVRIDASQLVADPDGVDKEKVSSSAKVTLSLNGKELAAQELKWDLAKNQYNSSHVFKLDDFAEGEYVVTAKFDKHPEQVVKKYLREKYVWENGSTGVTTTIFPPFQPVATDASTIRVVGREYGVGELGLWNSIKSLGQELLASPIVLKADGERILTGKAKPGKCTPQTGVLEAIAQDNAVTVKSVCTTEVDGCTKIELTLQPGAKKAELKSLALEIPLKAEQVPLWHAVTTAIRVNPMDVMPKGDGVVWDSRKFPNGDWIGAFVPYLWLGGVERGLCVFGNNDKGWVLNWNEKKQFTPCQEFIRSGDTVTVRLNLVQKPIVIEEERKIVIGLMASPGKPIPYNDWRGITPWGTGLGKGFEYLPRHDFDMGWSVETVFNAAYPIGRDYSIYEGRNRIPGTPGGNMVAEKGWGAFFDDWKKRHGLDKPAEQLTEQEKYALGRTGNGARLNSYNANYWDEYHNDFHLHPEVKVFSGEWGGNNMAQSRRDFRCYYAAETVKRGIGTYFDNAYPHASYDSVTSDAYDIPGLGRQPSANLWEQRDYHRRIWNIHREFGAKFKNKPMSMIHMTNTNVITMLTWNDMNVDLEWFYGPEPQQSKYGLSMLQAETSGRQSGCIPYALAIIENCRGYDELRMAERSKFGAMMVHDIRINYNGGELVRLGRLLHGFGYGLSGIIDSHIAGDTVYNYWCDNCPFGSDKPLVKGLLVKRGGELLLLASSWDKEPTTAVFTFDTKALDITLSAAADYEKEADHHRGLAAEAAMNKTKTAELVEKYRAQIADPKTTPANKKGLENAIAEQEKKAAAIDKQIADEEANAKKIDGLVKPVAFDATSGKLTVPFEGYGVRMIRIK